MDNIYKNPKVLYQENKIQGMYTLLFDTFLEDLEKRNVASKIYPHFMNLDWINKSYLSTSSNAEKVRDYIAGMTDRYFESTFREVIDPIPVRIRDYRCSV